ncbi:MAG: hypothetical protein V7L22_33645 [Nostoc sp.]|uniref:hypothetical protein n=1 Tax=Nostoc sp. TaxID=1180 RepID=UPI002FFB9D74
MMQIAREAFAAQVNPQGDKLIILLVDQAGWHTTRHLAVPKDIIMYSIPPYTPQLNPTECIYGRIKKVWF